MGGEAHGKPPDYNCLDKNSRVSSSVGSKFYLYLSIYPAIPKKQITSYLGYIPSVILEYAKSVGNGPSIKFFSVVLLLQ